MPRKGFTEEEGVIYLDSERLTSRLRTALSCDRLISGSQPKEHNQPDIDAHPLITDFLAQSLVFSR